MPPPGFKHGCVALVVDGLHFAEQGGYGLERYAHCDVHAVAEASLYAPGMVGECIGAAAVWL